MAWLSSSCKPSLTRRRIPGADHGTSTSACPQNSSPFKTCCSHVGVLSHVTLLGWAFKQVGYESNRRFDLVVFSDRRGVHLYFLRKLWGFLSWPAMIVMLITLAYLISHVGPALAGHTIFAALVPNKTTAVLIGVPGSANATCFLLLLLVRINLGLHTSLLNCVSPNSSLLHALYLYPPS